MALTNISITGYYTKPGYRFDVSPQLLRLLIDTVKKEILLQYTFPKVKSTELEIMLDTEIETNQHNIRQISKTTRGQYLSFAVALPYNKIVQNNEVKISSFIHEFFEALRNILATCATVPDLVIDQLRMQITNIAESKSEYKYVLSKERADFRKAIENFKANATTTKK